MIRHAAAVAAVLVLSPVSLYAQSPVLTVSSPSADVYKSPSTASPVIGHAQRGTPLEVTRELESWAVVSWPEAQDGIGYVPVSVGSMTRPPAARSESATSVTSGRPEHRLASPQPTSLRGGGALALEQPVLTRPVHVTPAPHVVGVGGLRGSTLGYGASARGWQRDRLGIQLEVSRAALTSAGAAGRVTSLQFEPSVLYSLSERMAHRLWLRPYVGSGLNFSRQRWSAAPGTGEALSGSSTALRVFGGSEVTFASVPQFAVSAELGYQPRDSFAGIALGGPGMSVSGHWYIR